MSPAFLILSLALVGLPVLPATASGPEEGLPPGAGQSAEVRLIGSDAQSIELALAVPEPVVRAVEAGNQVYSAIRVPGMGLGAEEGKPLLPVLGTVVGIPPGAQVTVEVLEAESEQLPGRYRIPPQASLEVEVPSWGGVQGDALMPRLDGRQMVEDEAVYGADAFYPGEIVDVAEPAWLRSQRLVGVQFYPVQYNPQTGEVVLNRRVRVRLHLAYPAGQVPMAWSAAAEPEAFESVLAGTLLNYASARAWRLPGGQAPVSGLHWELDWPAYRVLVDQEGVYEVTHGTLEAALGEPLGTVDAGTVQMYYEGQEIAIRVVDGGDGTFDAGDSVLFFGQGYESKYTAENVYWLTYGQATGLRMAEDTAAYPDSGFPPPDPPSTRASRHFETDVGYLSTMPGGDDLDRWFWRFAHASEEMAETVDLGHVAGAAGTATLTVALIGYTDDPDVGPDHHVEIYVNDHPDPVGDVQWDGTTYEVVDIPFDRNLLQAGNNEFRFKVPGDTGAFAETDLLDWFEVTYDHAYEVDGERLRFGGDQAGNWEYAISGFTGPGIEAYDVTDPSQPVWIQVIAGMVEDNGDGTFTLRFEDSRTEPRQYWAQTTGQRLAPARVELDSPSDLTASEAADYIILSHGDFIEALPDLLAARQAQGYSGLLVDVQDVYDEFGYGRTEPAAIRAFLSHAYQNWATSQVLLVGDGHFDPKNNLGMGRGNFIPAYLANVDPWLGEVATDNWYVDVASDKLPEMVIGRLPANTLTEAGDAVAKMEIYEGLAPTPWMNQLLFVTDNPDSGGDFYSYSDGVIADSIPDSYVTNKVYLGNTCGSGSACRSELLARVNDGQLLTNYVGHAGVEFWATEQILRIPDIQSLTNGSKLPVFLPMTCQEGAFHYPYPGAQALAEAVVMTPDVGGIASWSATGFGVVAGHDQLNRGFLDQLFGAGAPIIGPATLAGKLRLWATGVNLDLIDTYVLFGDPALHVRGLDADLQVGKAVEPAGEIRPGEVLTYTLTYTNAGPGVAHGVVVTDLIPSPLISPTVVFTSPEVAGQKAGVTFAWDIKDLTPGAAGEIQVRATVDPSTGPGTVTNVAEVSSAEPELAPGDNTASVSNPILVPDLWVDKTVQPSGEVAPGTILTYALTFGNAGNDIAQGVVLTDTVAGLLLGPEVLMVTEEVLGLVPGETFAWQIADLAPGEEGEIWFRARVDPSVELVEITNEGEIAGGNGDGAPGNNISSTTTTVGPLPERRVYLPLVLRQAP